MLMWRCHCGRWGTNVIDSVHQGWAAAHALTRWPGHQRCFDAIINRRRFEKKLVVDLWKMEKDGSARRRSEKVRGGAKVCCFRAPYAEAMGRRIIELSSPVSAP